VYIIIKTVNEKIITSDKKVLNSSSLMTLFILPVKAK